MKYCSFLVVDISQSAIQPRATTAFSCPLTRNDRLLPHTNGNHSGVAGRNDADASIITLLALFVDENLKGNWQQQQQQHQMNGQWVGTDNCAAIFNFSLFYRPFSFHFHNHPLLGGPPTWPHINGRITDDRQTDSDLQCILSIRLSIRVYKSKTEVNTCIVR